jgi:prolyl-tRNA editing enzyme YbaK/EbsC (Cys-tRNA(Pro) deacylase)
MKKNETREETFERLARNASEGAGAAKRFETLAKRVAKTLSAAAEAKSEEPAAE